MEKDKNPSVKKRFCFGLSNFNENGIGATASAIKDNSLAMGLGIENLEIYGYRSFAFFVLDVAQTVDLKNLKGGDEAKTIWERLNLNDALPLDRIFKKPHKGDPFHETVGRAKRTVMTLELKNDPSSLKAYKEIHGPENIWPQIIQNMDRMEIHDMEIYLHGCQAILLMDTALDFDMEKKGKIWADLPREREWQAYVAQFQKVDPKSNAAQKWNIMNPLVQL